MAFEKLYFNPVGGQARVQNSQAMWNYRHPDDNQATIVGSGYFNFLRDMVAPNDIIKIKPAGAVAFEVHYFEDVPKSPSTADVTINSLAIVAA